LRSGSISSPWWRSSFQAVYSSSAPNREDEDVVQRERALEQEAGEVLRSRLAALPGPERAAERDRDHQPDDRPGDRLAQRRRVAAREEQEVDHEHRDDEQREHAPCGGRYVEVETGCRCGDREAVEERRHGPSPWLCPVEKVSSAVSGR
jgi:hypothetical protein